MVINQPLETKKTKPIKANVNLGKFGGDGPVFAFCRKLYCFGAAIMLDSRRGVISLIFFSGKKQDFIEIFKKNVNFWPVVRFYYCSRNNRQTRSI
jgi:hypothetical protein